MSIIKRIKEWYHNKKGNVTIDELYNELRHYNKNELIKELIIQSGKNNKNDIGVELKFKKQIKNYSKKQIIKAIILLRLEQKYSIKRFERKYKKQLKKATA